VIPVKQTRFGTSKGNCLLACVASLLHRPLDSIPDFAMSGSWFEDLYEWCLNEGIGLICVHPKDLEHSIILNTFCVMIFTVRGIDNENHAVIGKCSREESPLVELKDGMKWKWVCEPTFDPNPNVVSVENLEHLIFLIPKLGGRWDDYASQNSARGKMVRRRKG